jgi:hypothetical protein
MFISLFYGFKLHVITNDCNGIIYFVDTLINIHDTNQLKIKSSLVTL